MSIVQVDVKDYIAHVKLNRPEKINALSLEMFDAVLEAGQTIQEDKSIRAVVLSGEGKGFCSGLDVESFIALADPDVEVDLFNRPENNPANYAQLMGFIWKQIDVPVIAALHGAVFGGGFQIAMGADIRYASPDARLSIMEIKWGLVPDMSGTQTLRDLVRLDVAKELAFTGRIVEAEEALGLGLVTRLCDDPLKEARKVAAEIASKSPDAIVADKKLFETAWRGSVEEGLKLEETLQKTLIGSLNQIEAAMANFEKRNPNFAPRE
ncbi:MAG: crotonase/enoyl-CoA hydratase family protein [Desulfobacterales bacterium]|nr:crotonase/enoyl-CoA hydratase family protein [Desulfobacterales bacterium]